MSHNHRFTGCPFCGKDAEIEVLNTMIRVGCKPCGFDRAFAGPLSKGEVKQNPDRITCTFVNPSRDYDHGAIDRAAEAWNTRTASSTVDAPLCCNHNCNQGRDCPLRKNR